MRCSTRGKGRHAEQGSETSRLPRRPRSYPAKEKKRQTPRVSMRGVRQIQRLPEHIIDDGQRQIDIVRHPIDAAAEKNQEK